jgi:hypothetical protein
VREYVSKVREYVSKYKIKKIKGQNKEGGYIV